ncbi:MAG TPA: hypothetical protein VJO52_09370 [Gemmatimonadaceae bacterium]|nr:hypothetical protein [Gemmatimonadaceae bacterium]
MLKHADLIADSLGFFILIAKTWFDVWGNEARTKKDQRRFESDASTKSQAEAKALSAKIKRRDTSNMLTFLALAVSFLFAILGDLYGKA